MKILIITSSHPTKSAGIVAYDLFKGLKEINGNEVRILTKAWDKYKDDNIISIDSNMKEYLYRVWDLRRRIIKKLLKVLFGYKVNEEPKIKIKTNPDYAMMVPDQTETYYKTKKLLMRAGFIPDAILALFLPRFISYKNLYELNQITKAPVFLYLQDMAQMTGGCHYAWNCKEYMKKCGKCPALYSSDEQDQSRINWEYKKGYLDKTDITAIVSSEWQYLNLQNSSLLADKPKHKILLGIDSELFKPGDKKQAREYLNLPLDKTIIFFGAVFYLRNRSKGFKELIEALNILKSNLKSVSCIHLAIAGNGDKALNDIVPFDYTYLGYLNFNQLATAFQAADIFVCPSLQDAGPMTIRQSIMSGTPVVAFEMGVALDLVHTGETGYRAKLGNVGDLANGLKNIIELDLDNYNKMSCNCRELGLKLYCPPQQSKNIFNVIENVLVDKS